MLKYLIQCQALMKQDLWNDMKHVSVNVDQMEMQMQIRLEEKGFIWNPSNCEYECDKSFDIGEYLDYKNCRCRKKIVDKLIDECTETIEEVKLANITIFENGSCERSSCIVYIALMIVVFKIFTGITVYFVYYNWSLIKNNVSWIKFGTHKETM